MISRSLAGFAGMILFASSNFAAEPLHQRIDRIIESQAKKDGIALSPQADDGEFLRRAWLDFAGKIPPADVAKAFLADKSKDKRAKAIEQLLNGPDYAARMADAFNVMLMERMGEGAEWIKYLQASFAANKPWDAMVREILRADPKNEAAKGAGYFLAKRLDKYGQNPVEYSALTRDVGRLFLGKDLRCAECHDHLFIDDYKQKDFQGLHTFFMNTTRISEYEVGEKPTLKKTPFASVFTKVQMETGPALPGMVMIEIPQFKMGEEFLEKPDPKAKKAGVPKFSTLASIAEKLPIASNADFTRNSANRLWFILMGRGIVHPLDLHHSRNLASHPELLDLLAKEFAEKKFDVKYLFREIALSNAYQRSSQVAAGKDVPPEKSFAVALEKRLTSDQMLASVLTGLSMKESTGLKAKFHKAFDNQAREPEDEITPSLKAALFVLHDESMLALFKPAAGNLIERAAKLDDAAVAEELYIAILTRTPSADEKAAVAKVLAKHTGDKRAEAIGRIAWALATSMEFGVNH